MGQSAQAWWGAHRPRRLTPLSLHRLKHVAPLRSSAVGRPRYAQLPWGWLTVGRRSQSSAPWEHVLPRDSRGLALCPK
eukprot:9466424-Pyramimonas_sp.AAC.1